MDPKDLEKDLKDFQIYSYGLIYMSVCSSLPIEEIEARANTESPTGISSQWSLSKEKKFANETPMPCSCEVKPKTHKHYLLSC